nr:protein F52E1.6 [imported] - Caenorhabditis elegans [Caenorhabditis elegans]
MFRNSDLDCGGLRNGCDSNGNCDCVNAFHSHGYKLFVKVLLTFCHQTKCTKTSDNCYGLPCRVGKCKCFVGSGVGSKLPVHYFKPAGK